MPELPEVETVVRSLAPRLEGQTIDRVATSASRVFRGQQLLIEAGLPGERIRQVTRYGKNILFLLDRFTLRIHLGMTGKLLFASEASTHPRATLWLRDETLVFDDTRQFGRFELLSVPPAESLALGPDPLEITREAFAASLRLRGGGVKSLLLNQRFLRGLGNIYVDEALFAAGIHPLTPASGISVGRANVLYLMIQQLLAEAIAQGGSSISDYVDSDGRRGSFQDRHQVYGREGMACHRCGATVRRIVVAQRGTHFCPRCQRPPRTPRPRPMPGNPTSGRKS